MQDATVSAGHADTWLGEALYRVQTAANTELRERLVRENDTSRLREDFADDDGHNGSANGIGGSPPSPDDVLAIGNGPFNQQQYLYDRWSSIAKCFWAAAHDPVADATLEIIVNFVVGRGFTVTCKDPEAQAEWDAFWKLNHGPSRIKNIGCVIGSVTAITLPSFTRKEQLRRRSRCKSRQRFLR